VSEGTVDARHRHLAQQARRFRARRRLYTAICYAVLALACAGALGPYFYLLSTSLKKTSYLYTLVFANFRGFAPVITCGLQRQGG
jgi:hypothetical protein